MNKNILFAVAAILAAGAVLWWLTQSKTSSPASTTPASEQTSTPQSPSPVSSENALLTYSDSGFSPSRIEVKSGGKITVINRSSRIIDFASNPHPIHTDNLDLNLGAISPGQSKSGTLTKKGEWRYHDHLNVSAGGQVIVF